MADPRPVVPRRLATQDIQRAAAHYVEHADPATALRFIDAVEQTFTRIGRHPGAGSPRYAAELDLHGLRTRPVGRFPYLVFYFEVADHVDVWRILHVRRDLPVTLQDPPDTA
jgi:toxin ParE1/3/4